MCIPSKQLRFIELTNKKQLNHVTSSQSLSSMRILSTIIQLERREKISDASKFFDSLHKHKDNELIVRVCLINYVKNICNKNEIKKGTQC